MDRVTDGISALLVRLELSSRFPMCNLVGFPGRSKSAALKARASVVEELARSKKS